MRGEHDDVVVAVEGRLHGVGKARPVAAGLVDSDAHRAQARKEHQQVVDKIAELAVVVTADDRAQANAVLTAKRMVAHENIAFAVVLVGKVLLAC